MRVTVFTVVLVVAAGRFATTSQPASPAASLSGPVSGGKGQAFGALAAQDLAASRYTEAEYFVSGTSQSFEKSGPWRDPDPIPPGAHIRTDTGVPVFDLQTEGDMVALGSHLARQADSSHYRLWEIAGAAHAESPQWVPGIAPVPDLGVRCVSPINSAPHHAVVKAGLDALTRWVRDGEAPRSSPGIALGDSAAPDPLLRDAHGLAKGGIRLPELEAPTAVLDGLRNDVPPGTPGGQNFCFLFGHTRPFDAAQLATLYPTHDVFVRKFNTAVDAMVRAGYWLKPEADLARAAARQAPIGK